MPFPSMRKAVVCLEILVVGTLVGCSPVPDFPNLLGSTSTLSTGAPKTIQYLIEHGSNGYSQVHQLAQLVHKMPGPLLTIAAPKESSKTMYIGQGSVENSQGYRPAQPIQREPEPSITAAVVSNDSSKTIHVEQGSNGQHQVHQPIQTIHSLKPSPTAITAPKIIQHYIEQGPNVLSLVSQPLPQHGSPLTATTEANESLKTFQVEKTPSGNAQVNHSLPRDMPAPPVIANIALQESPSTTQQVVLESPDGHAQVNKIPPEILETLPSLNEPSHTLQNETDQISNAHSQTNQSTQIPFVIGQSTSASEELPKTAHHQIEGSRRHPLQQEPYVPGAAEAASATLQASPTLTHYQIQPLLAEFPQVYQPLPQVPEPPLTASSSLQESPKIIRYETEQGLNGYSFE